jgi:hypothetical protein
MTKIVGIGLGKTGTTTLGECFRELGYSVKGFDAEAIRSLRRGEIDRILDDADKYDAFEDFPWPFLYQEIDKRYPGSKFVLTKRKNVDIWYQSLVKHADRTGPTPAKLWCYGHRLPYFFTASHKRLYESHIRSVRDYFAGRPEDLLEICWEEEKGWDRLTEFLGSSPVEKNIPHLNRSPRGAAGSFIAATRAKHVLKALAYQLLGRYSP